MMSINSNMTEETNADLIFSQSDSAFGKFKVRVARELSPDSIKILEVLYDFPRFERRHNTELAFVEKLVEKGIIRQNNVSGFVDDLKEELHLTATAEKISNYFKDYLQEKEQRERQTHLTSAEMDQTRKQSLANTQTKNSSKRKSGSSLGAIKEKKAKRRSRSFSRIGFNEECSLFIYELSRSLPPPVGRNKALFLGIAFDLTSNCPERKLLYTTDILGEMFVEDDVVYRLKSGRKITEGSCYKLSKCYHVEWENKRGVLLTPHTRYSLVSRRMFRDISFEKLAEDGLDGHFQHAVEQKMYLPWSTVTTVKNKFPKGHTVFYLKGVVKETDYRQPPPSARLVLTLIDDDSGNFLSVVVLLEHKSKTMKEDLVENDSVLLKFFKTSGEGDTNYLISTEESVIKVIKDESLRYLTELDESREVNIIQVDEIQFYLACPNCFHTKLDGTLRCPSCEVTFSKNKVENYFHVKLWLELTDVDDNTDGETIVDGLIFKDEMMKTITSYDPSVKVPQTEEEFTELSEILFDKNAKVIIKPKGDKPNNVFRKLRILKN